MDAKADSATFPAPPGDMRWRILLLTCRDPETDFRRPLAEELQALGHDVSYIYLKRRPVVTEMADPSNRREFSLPGFMAFARRRFRGAVPLLVFNSTNLAFPGLSLTLRAICGGLWCLDMHDDLLYATRGLARRRAELAQRLLLAGSDFTVRAAPTLAELFPDSHPFGNASAIRPIERGVFRADRILVMAGLDGRFDFPLLARAAELNPGIVFDIYGQMSSPEAGAAVELGELKRRSNVECKGPYTNAPMPSILEEYCVTFAPYRTSSQLTRFLDPLRYYHCLNSGMEVISTDIPKAHDFGERIHLIREATEIGPLIRRLSVDPEARRNGFGKRIVEDWETRARQLMEITSQIAHRTARAR